MPRFSIHYLENLAREWQRAYEAANDKPAPAVRWSRGWFRITIDDGPLGKGYRRKELELMRDNLRAQTKG